MVQINFAQKQINAKIVYYGPGMSGKTTNLEVVHQRAPAPNRGDLTSISTDGDRTLFFDYMPLDLGTVAGMRTCFQMYTVPGQVYYNSTRKLVLQGCDGVIFVADSQESMREQNIESLKNLEENLAEYGKNLADLPLVIQYNKRDMPGAVSVETLEADLNPNGVPSFEAVANTGQGVFPTLKALAAVVLKNLSQEHAIGGSGAPAQAPAAPTPTAQAAPAQPAPAASAPPAPQPTQPAEAVQQFAPPAQAPVDGPPPAVPQPAAASADTGPVSVPLMDTGIQPRNQVLPEGVDGPAAPIAAYQQPPVQLTQTSIQPAPQGAATAAVAQEAPPQAAPTSRTARQKAPATQTKSAPRSGQRRAKAASQPTAKKQNNLLYTGAFVVLATAVGVVLAKAILSFL